MSVQASKLNAYAVLAGNAVQVSKLNIYAIIDIIPGSTIASITSAAVEVWVNNSNNSVMRFTQAQVEVWGSSFVVGNLLAMATAMQTEVWATTALFVPSSQVRAMVLA